MNNTNASSATILKGWFLLAFLLALAFLPVVTASDARLPEILEPNGTGPYRVVRHDATVKIDGLFYEVPPGLVGHRVDLRFPVVRPDELFLYQDDRPVAAIQPVDLVDNARFHAHAVELNYAELLRQRQEEEANEPAKNPETVVRAEARP